MLKQSLFSLPIALFLTSAAFAQTIRAPRKGSAERTTILDTLRVPVAKELKQKIRCNINAFNALGNWAFVSGEPQNLTGGRPNYVGTIYQEQFESDAFDNNFFALLKKAGGKWMVLTHAIGCTDFCYATWCNDYKAPKAVFPYTE
jgi:hypothetical protein